MTLEAKPPFSTPFYPPLKPRVGFLKKKSYLDFVRLAKINKYLLNITTPITLIKSASLSHFL